MLQTADGHQCRAVPAVDHVAAPLALTPHVPQPTPPPLSTLHCTIIQLDEHLNDLHRDCYNN